MPWAANSGINMPKRSMSQSLTRSTYKKDGKFSESGDVIIKTKWSV
jgi:hypothetical protein